MRIFAFVLAFIGIVEAHAEWALHVPEIVLPGSAFVVGFRSDEVVYDLNATVSYDGLVICSNTGYELSSTIKPVRVYAVMLGIPSTVEYGKVSVRLSGTEAGRLHEQIVEIDLGVREFIVEEIRLDRVMSALRRSDEAEIVKQAERLWKILLTSNPRSTYLDQSMRSPLDVIRHTAYFGDRRVYLYSDGSTDRSIHNGIDYGGPTGTPVYSAGRGVVVSAETRIITGNTVIIEHLPGTYSLYCHLDSISVSSGSLYESGVQIGTIGSTGLVTGPHLHWEVRVAGVAVDPEDFWPGAAIGTVLDTAKLFGHIVP